MFTHLHLHTQYSLLEGAIRIKDLVPSLKRKGFESCAITDHGNMFGAVEFYHAMRDSNLKPIIGLGASVIEENSKEEHSFSTKKYNHPGHVLFLCKKRCNSIFSIFTLFIAFTFPNLPKFGHFWPDSQAFQIFVPKN